MTTASLLQFKELVTKDQAFSEKLKAVTDYESFIKLYIQFGKENGYSFTVEGVESALKMAMVAEEESLSEEQWEFVAGNGAAAQTKSVCTNQCSSSACNCSWWEVYL